MANIVQILWEKKKKTRQQGAHAFSIATLFTSIPFYSAHAAHPSCASILLLYCAVLVVCHVQG